MLKEVRFEKGIFLALVATIVMGVVNFLFGYGARETSPLLVNWFMNVFIAAAILIYLFFKKEIRDVVCPWRQDKKLIMAVSLFDNLAWIFFAYSMAYIPIAIATGISESYISLTVALGVIINKERIKKHQWVGIALVLTMAGILAILSER
jgi:drug/metabolite transporter (DMT)-like permease